MTSNSAEKVFIGTLFVILSSCGNTNQESANNSTSIQTELSPKEKVEALSIDFLGNYHGIQPSYFMENQYGEYLILNGQKISVPSIDFKFLLKENNVVSLQQINLDDNNRVYYDGTYKITLQVNNIVKIECSLSDGQNSNPTYILTINKGDKKGICNGRNEPEFNIEKLDK